MNDTNSIFNKALANMTDEVAYKAAMRHLVESEYSIHEIQNKLTYPIGFNRLQKAVYEYMTECGMIVLNKPLPDENIIKAEYILDEDKYGKKTYRRVLKKIDSMNNCQYRICDFGTFDEATKCKIKEKLYAKEWEYISDIPWPTHRVYVLNNDRLISIIKKIEIIINNESI